MLGLSVSKLIIRIITLVIAFTVHEFSHAWTANSFGDQTPKDHGRLTLNPLVHLDPFGSLLLLVAGFGWAKPVPVNPYVLNQRSPSAFMWVSLAGPLSNLIMAVLAAIPIRLGLIQYQISSSTFIPTAYEFAIEFIIINLALMLFNLIPLAPLDGEKVLDFLLPQNLRQGWNKIKQYGPIILLAGRVRARMRVDVRREVEGLLSRERPRRRLRHVVLDEARRALEARHGGADRVRLGTPERRDGADPLAIGAMAGAAGLCGEERLAARNVADQRVGHGDEAVGAVDLGADRDVLGDEGHVREQVGHLATLHRDGVAGERAGEAVVHAVGECDHGAGARHVLGKARVRAGERGRTRLEPVVLVTARAAQVPRGVRREALGREAQEVEPASDRGAHGIVGDVGFAIRLPRRFIEGHRLRGGGVADRGRGRLLGGAGNDCEASDDDADAGGTHDRTPAHGKV